jgi:hypothetical protein
MANGTRNLTLLAVLVVGLAVGWFIGHGKPEPTPEPSPTPVPTANVPPATPAPTPICTPQVTPVAGAHDWKLTVGPDPCKVTDENGNPAPIANISKGHGHKIVFQPSSPQLSLAIVIHVPRSSPKPFKNLAFDGYDPQGLVKWLLCCDDPQKPCSTGPAAANAEYGCYKYDQILEDKECDAGIIIEK